MPQREDDGGAALSTRIANIEEYLPNITHSLPRKEIRLTPRSPYARHTLVGLNDFVLAMFEQFDVLLGVPQPAPPDPSDEDKTRRCWLAPARRRRRWPASAPRG